MVKVVIKRDGRKVPFNPQKIYEAISKAALTYNPELFTKITSFVTNDITKEEASVEEIQDLVEKALVEFDQYDTAKAYILYRDQRTKARDLNSTLNKTLHELVSVEANDSDLKRENANIDGNAPMGIMLQFGSEISKKFTLDNLLNPTIARAHIEGDLHIHDLNFFPITWNCCQIPAGKLLQHGFSTGHGHIRKPNNIQTAAALMCILIQSNQNEQFGGQAIPTFEYDLAPYVVKSFIKHFTRLMQIEGFDRNSRDLLEKKINQFYEENGTIDGSFFTIAKLTLLKKLYAGAWEFTKQDTYQAMEALIHNLNTMQSRCIEENQEVLSLDLSSVKNFNKLSDIEKDALKDLLETLYKDHTLVEIAQELNSSKKVITNIFKLLGIHIRNPKEKAEFNKNIYLKRFGVDNPMKLKEIQDKVKDSQFRTNNGKYAFNSEKQKQTMLAKYGVENIMQNPAYRQELQRQLKEKYGVTCTLQLDSVREKAEQTCLERYGAKNVLCKESSIYPNYNFNSHPELQTKAYSTLKDKYGSSGFGSPLIKEKIRETCLDKYGYANPALALMHGKSKSESIIVDSIKTAFPTLELHLNKRSLFSCDLRLEVDIFIPELLLGIEVNGAYSHDKKQYLQDLAFNTCVSKERFKELEAINNGFTLIHIWEDSLAEDTEKVLKIIEGKIHG